MPTATTSASALSRHGASARASVYPVNRSSSPPASTYFTPFSGDHHEDPQPASAEASSHFAYSTSLVRHRENSLGLPLPASANGLPKFEDLRRRRKKPRSKRRHRQLCLHIIHPR